MQLVAPPKQTDFRPADTPMIRYHDPRPQRPGDDGPQPRPGSVVLGGDGPWHFGLLANGFRDAERFLQHVAEQLREDAAGSRSTVIAKASPPEALRPEQLQALARGDAAILAYGH
jgi:hypothetical protein